MLAHDKGASLISRAGAALDMLISSYLASMMTSPAPRRRLLCSRRVDELFGAAGRHAEYWPSTPRLSTLASFSPAASAATSAVSLMPGATRNRHEIISHSTGCAWRARRERHGGKEATPARLQRYRGSTVDSERIKSIGSRSITLAIISRQSRQLCDARQGLAVPEATFCLSLSSSMR